MAKLAIYTQKVGLGDEKNLWVCDVWIHIGRMFRVGP
jgi:hypothetical protein